MSIIIVYDMNSSGIRFIDLIEKIKVRSYSFIHVKMIMFRINGNKIIVSATGRLVRGIL